MTNDGTNSYTWDAENRMTKITYPGVNNYSTFGYDGYSRNISIIETTAGSITSTKQFVWTSDERREERDVSGALTKKFYELGQINSTTKYFYSKDHLDSIREMADNTGVVQAQYAYDSFGRQSKISETVSADLGYAGYYGHSRSGFGFTLTRPFSSFLGRFIRRDSIEESGGVNLYAYVQNSPISQSDPNGMGAIGGIIGGSIGGVLGGIAGKNFASAEAGAEIGWEIGSGTEDVIRGAAIAAGVLAMAKDRGSSNVKNEWNVQAEKNCSGRGFNTEQTKECICVYLQALYDWAQNAEMKKSIYTALKGAGCQCKQKRAK